MSGFLGIRCHLSWAFIEPEKTYSERIYLDSSFRLNSLKWLLQDQHRFMRITRTRFKSVTSTLEKLAFVDDRSNAVLPSFLISVCSCFCESSVFLSIYMCDVSMYLVFCCSGGCLLCMLCFPYLLFTFMR